MLAYGAVQHPRTIFKAIQSFPPGTVEIITPDTVDSPASPRTFWTFPPPSPAPPTANLVASIRSTIETSVRDHLVSDVPVGLFLSSGLDSTIVAGVAGKLTPHLRSFTVGFEDNLDLSEMELASKTAKLFGLDHTRCQITAHHAEAIVGEWLSSLDIPSMDGLNVYAISKAVRAQGITVALSGQGGDELFGGYPSFHDVPRFHQIMRRAGWIPAPLRRSMARAAVIGKSYSVRQKAIAFAGGDGSLLSLYAQRRRVMSDSQLAALGFVPAELGLTRNFLDPEIEADLRRRDETIDDPVWSISQFESRLYMGNMLLRDGDTNGMAHCLEIRVPLLDQRLLDLAYPLPGKVRLPSGRADKHLLRAAFPDFLRPALLHQGKKGFTLPIRRWMLGPLREMCEAGLQHLRENTIFRSEGIDAIWTTFQRDPESPIWSRAFTLCTLGLYLQSKRAELGGIPTTRM